MLGSTGSVGEKALAVAARFPERLTVTGLSAHANVTRLAEQVALFRPAHVVVSDPAAAAGFDRSCLPPGATFRVGAEAAAELAGGEDVDIVLNAIVGGAGLAPTLAALRPGRTLALANKESIVLAGELVTATAARVGARLLPIDSEHSGAFQCLGGVDTAGVRRVILTASGGPFRTWTAEQLRTVEPEQALKHPVWPMGPRISVDSATLLNKGFEVIEARWLFNIPVERIEVLIHPQSYVHALVEMEDGSTLAQMAPPDMILPVQYALSWPERWTAPLPPHDLARNPPLEFSAPDHARFPGLRLAYRAVAAGGVQPAMLNAADEVAVAAFLARRLRFTDIPVVLAAVLDQAPVAGQAGYAADSLGGVLAADQLARARAAELVRQLEPARSGDAHPAC